VSDLKETRQTPAGGKTGHVPQGDEGADNHGADFGTAERGTRGTNRDADPSGTSANQGHGHPREERGGDR
jgi:hypothetical protein